MQLVLVHRVSLCRTYLVRHPSSLSCQPVTARHEGPRVEARVLPSIPHPCSDARPRRRETESRVSRRVHSACWASLGNCK